MRFKIGSRVKIYDGFYPDIMGVIKGVRGAGKDTIYEVDFDTPLLHGWSSGFFRIGEVECLI